MADKSLSGLTEAEAKEFHSVFVSSFLGFVVVAAIAHVLAWMWRPWARNASVVDGVNVAVSHLASYLS